MNNQDIVLIAIVSIIVILVLIIAAFLLISGNVDIIGTIFGFIALIAIIVITIFGIYNIRAIQNDYNTKINDVVDQVNNAQYYEYQYSQKQSGRVSNVETNLIKNQEQNSKTQEQIAKSQEQIAKTQQQNSNLENNLMTTQEQIAKTQQQNSQNFNTTTLNTTNLSTDNLNTDNVNANNIKGNNVNVTGPLAINDDSLYLRKLNDKNHTLQYTNSVDGPRLTGCAGGELGTICNGSKTALKWDNAGAVTTNDIKITNAWSNFPNTGKDKSEISNDTNQFKQLMIVGNRSAGGARQVGVWDKLNVNGDLNVTGTSLTNNIKFTNNWSDFSKAGKDKSEISNDTKNFKQLMILGNRSAGGARKVGIWDKLDVNGDALITNNLEVKSELTANNLKFTKGWSDFSKAGKDKSEISNDTKNFKQLMILGNRSAGGARKVGIWDKLDVNGDLNVTNNLAVKSQICIDNVCISKNDLKNIKNLIKIS